LRPFELDCYVESCRFRAALEQKRQEFERELSDSGGESCRSLLRYPHSRFLGSRDFINGTDVRCGCARRP
jgi:hypothetical protein